MLSYQRLVAQVSDHVPGWLWGFGAGVVLCVVGPAGAFVVFLGGFLYITLTILYFHYLAAVRGPQVTTPDIDDVRLLIRPLLITGAGLVGMVVSGFAQVAALDPVLQVLWFINAVLLSGLVLLCRWHVRTERTATTAQSTPDQASA